MNFIIGQLSTADLDRIQPLWEKLNAIHAKKSPHFSHEYLAKNFPDRKNELLLKASSAQTALFTALTEDSKEIAGYCFASAQAEGIGELDSLYVDESYRKSHLGQALMGKAVDWMDQIGVRRKIIEVYSGNEEVLPFYQRFGFYPKKIVLEFKDLKFKKNSGGNYEK